MRAADDLRIGFYPKPYLRRRNRWIDRAAHALFAATFALILFGGGSGAPLWRASALLSVPFLAMTMLIALVTLPQGPARLREFRLYHQMVYGVSDRAMTWLYLPMAMIGMISAAKIWW